MQNRYVGDVGDFGKHGLLRFLSGMTSEDNLARLRLGLVWYLHHDEKHGADGKKISRDGKHIGYLNPTLANLQRFGECDQELWNKLGHLVGLDARCVHCAELANILPGCTNYYDAQLYYVPKMKPDKKAELRDHWIQEALNTTREADIVCLDPDNGIAKNNNNMYTAKGPKFTYMDDLKAFWKREQSLVVYHHLDMLKGEAEDKIEAVSAKIREGLEGAKPISLWFHRGTARVFFVVPQPGEPGNIIRERVDRFLGRPWGQNKHFTRV